LKLDEVQRRFEVMTAARLSRGKTRSAYWSYFRRLAECEKPGCGHLTDYTRRQLAGDKGKELLISHYTHIADKVRVFAMAAIKKVWTRGLELPWPLVKDDLPPSRHSERGMAPRRDFVSQWVQAAREE